MISGSGNRVWILKVVVRMSNGFEKHFAGIIYKTKGEGWCPLFQHGGLSGWEYFRPG